METTISNLAIFRNKIPIESLSKTIRDAVLVSRNFGIQYLWIDALCIIQDSPDDKRRELSRMGAIYHNSILTIAAVDSDDTAEGLFTSPKRSSSSSNRSYSRPTGILDTRGWTAQEQLLSRRVLSYTNSGIFWSCAKWNCSEECPAEILHRTPDISENQALCERDFQKFRQRILMADRGNDQEQTYWLWRKVVRNYTMRDLTKKSDRIIAISGIGSMLGKLLNDELIAGIWKGRFAAHLTWSVKHHEHGERLPPSYQRPSSFRAPTWSWASVAGPVTYGDDNVWQEFGEFRPEIEILDINVQTNPTNHSISGSLKLRGMLYKTYYHEERDSHFLLLGRPDTRQQYRTGRYSPVPKRYQDKWEFMRPDVLPVPATEIYCLFLGCGGHGIWRQYTLCLIPVPGGVKNEFQRIGITSWNPRHVTLRDGIYNPHRYRHEGVAYDDLQRQVPGRMSTITIV